MIGKTMADNLESLKNVIEDQRKQIETLQGALSAQTEITVKLSAALEHSSKIAKQAEKACLAWAEYIKQRQQQQENDMTVMITKT